jgi:transcriptional regulator with XRE-family HTH domain
MKRNDGSTIWPAREEHSAHFCFYMVLIKSVFHQVISPRISLRACVTNHRLPNYLRAYRKKCGFSQEELAYAVKLNDKSAWCNLERFRRQPSLRTALACEEFFDVPVSRLFAGTKVSAARETRRRMQGPIIARILFLKHVDAILCSSIAIETSIHSQSVIQVNPSAQM